MSSREPMAAPATPDDEHASAKTSRAMATVLFADDDPFALQALRHDTAPWCDVWDVHYADGPAAALDRLRGEMLTRTPG